MNRFFGTNFKAVWCGPSSFFFQAYPMMKIPRGKAIIINVQTVAKMSARTGTDIDRENLRSLFEQLHFTVDVHNDNDSNGTPRPDRLTSSVW